MEDWISKLFDVCFDLVSLGNKNIGPFLKWNWEVELLEKYYDIFWLMHV